jgi:hypothetical protein
MSAKFQKGFFEVEAIQGERYSRKKRRSFYFIKWLGYDKSQNTWEPEENLNNVRDMIASYKNQQR